MPSKLHLGAGGLFAVATLCLIIGLAVNTMYELTIGDRPKSTMGIFKTCSDGTCDDYNWDTFESTGASADRKASDVKMRFYGMRIAFIAGVLMASGATGTSFGVIAAKVPVLRVASLVLGILGAFGGGAGLALFSFTIDNWLYGSRTFCEFSGAENCKNVYGVAFYIASLGVLLALVGIIIAALAMRAPWDEENQSNEPTNEDQRMDGTANYQDTSYQNTYQESSYQETNNTTYAQDNQQEAPACGAHGVPEPPEGDWVYDETSGLYWSDTNYLYLDTTTNQYYDPDSGQWYDPDSGEWYEKA